MPFRATSGSSPSPRAYAGLRLVDDASVGDWIGERIDNSRTVHSLIPSGFEAHAVIFHPAYREVDAGEQPSLFAPFHLASTDWTPVYHREVRWSEVATANGRVAHPTMEWAAITGLWAYRWGGEQPGIWNLGPQHGSLPLRPAMRLCQLLAQHTTTPTQCFFGASFIYGDLPEPVMKAAHALDTCVLTGPLLALPSNSLERKDPFRHRSPNLWWAADRAWFVHSNYDLQQTYLGGSRQCVEQLLADPGLEAMRIGADQPLTDETNPEPAGNYQG